LAIVILIILGLTYFTAWKITVIKNQGGEKKAIFWVIMVSISITFNYLIFLPIICIIKTKIILTYGPFHPRKFFFSFKYFLFLLLITEVDRAVFKELKETIKNNNLNDKIMTSLFGLEDEEISIEESTKLKKTIDDNNKNNHSQNKIDEFVQFKDKQIDSKKNYEILNKRYKELTQSKINKLDIEDIQRIENLEKEENDKK